ncbi:zinc finger protein 40 isoform X2 [Varanus komodoensis]|uniref:Zinc finger protein 40 n=1 Tax=Varanus komodoensis TaxID=61221 RepID=A0A8D2Q900_VARKO|nr:zinc finger protein 40 isoform X2 [Varanus komodoensis]XP_044311549.1 zinc finger protein 40 isoform X2 [Varanus komodoensis]XP_044311550.1 zinc finger protein 40 isoform X2 [Varanus komodoensis]XP_044311551.1 zinc finger protein 40 isoform X2 [Varanus komodoensis]XP_044311552.1 zinc finger protein 40 isoform X2 [Varanus komodoensis]XP_044311553.1 zinc finger protein 40 isoform X2 [Varanus komodoensis]XP_044311554.1 zinc finger protein 40 isoform X2 [Varanus komodoensis]XP_044311555.1 zin
MRMPRTKQINPRNLRDKIEEAQKELNETEDPQKDISEAATRGSTDTVKGVKRKKIVTENHQTKIPKSPLRTPARAKPKEKVKDTSSSSNILPDTSELLKEVHSLLTQNGKQNKQNEGTPSSEVAIKTSLPETSVPTKLSLLPQSLDLNKWPVEDYGSAQLNLPVKKGSTNPSSTAEVNSNECINFVNCSNSSSCTNTAFDVLLKAMEPELNTLAQECPSSGMQMEKLRPNKTISASYCLASNTPTVQSHAALLQQEFVAGSQLYPSTSQTVHVATSGTSEQAQMHSVVHSQDQVLTKAGQQSQQIAACPSFTNSLVQQQNQEKLKLQHVYSIAVTSSIISPQSPVTQAFSQNQLVAKSSSPLLVHPSSSTPQLPIAPLYSSAQIASVVSHGVEQICHLLKVQKPKKLGKYVCQYCSRACAKPSVLQKHIRSHTGERPYPCETCGFSFKTKSNLYKHKKSHAHAIKLGLVLQPDSSGLYLSHESDKTLSIHSDVEESGDSDDEGTADERQDDQGSLELEAAHTVKIPSNSEPSHKDSPISLSNPEYMLGDSLFQDSAAPARTALPKVIVYPVNVSPLRSSSPKVEDSTAVQQGDLKVTNVKPNLAHIDFIKESDAKQHPKSEASTSEEQLGTLTGTVIHAQLQRQQATDCSQDQQGKCLLSPRSLGSTDSGYFSRSESTDQTMSPPVPFTKGLPASEKDSSKSCVPRMSTPVASVVQTVSADKTLLSSGQMRPPLATKTLEERISKLISDNEAVVDDKQLDSVKPRRTSLSRRGSIDSPKSYIFKDSFQFDLKPMGRRTSSSSDIPKSPFTPTEKSKPVFLLSVPTLDCLPITRSNSMPTTSYSAVAPNVVPPPHPLRGSQSFDEKIGSSYDDVFVPGPTTLQLQGGHPRTLVRQTAIEDSSASEGHTFGPTRSVDESYGGNTSNEFLMTRSKSFVQGSNLDKIKKPPQGRGTMFECETCRNRYRKLENFENHKKFYCSELHGPKTKAAIRDSEHKTVVNSAQPQILHYRVATSTGVWEQTSQIRKRRKMKSVGDDDDEPQTTDASLSKSVAESECQNKLGSMASVAKHSAAVLGSSSISLQQLAQDDLETRGGLEQTMESKMLLHGEKQAVTATQEKNELKRQGAGISVIQHTNSLSRPSSFEKSDSFESVSPVSFQDANKVAKLHCLNTIIAQEEKHPILSASHAPQVVEASRVQLHECQVTPNERNVTVQPLRLVRQHNIQVPEILVTEEPDRDQECQCSDQEKTEKFNWPQRSETLSKLPTEKLPPKKKRIRLAEIEHSSAESSFESTLSRSLSRESSLSCTSSFSASFDKDDTFKNESASKPELTNKSQEFLTIPASSNTLSVPSPHYREMRRAASEQINCTQPSIEVADYRSKSFDCGRVAPSGPASLTETPTSKLASGSGAAGHVPLLERRRGPLVRQISLNIAPEKNQPDMANMSFQPAPATDISTVPFPRLQSSRKPSEEVPSRSQHPQTYAKPLRDSVKNSNPLNLPSSEQSIGSSLNRHGQQTSLSQPSQTSLKGPALGTQKSINMVAGQHSVQEDCFAPKYQLQLKALHVGQQYPLGLPGTAGTEQAAASLEIHPKVTDNASKPYVAQSLQQAVPDNGGTPVYQVAPFIVPVRIHSNIPSYGLATVAPLPQILVTRDQANQSLCQTDPASVPTVKGQTQLPKSHKDHLRCLPSLQPASLFENSIYDSTSLGSLNLIQKVPVGRLIPQQEATASSKRMLSPANSLDIAMEKQQKRVKDESGAACTTGAMSLHPLMNVKTSEANKQKKPLLVRQICTMEPLESFSLDQEEKSSGISHSPDGLLQGSAESSSGVSSFIKEPLEHNLPASETVGFAARNPRETVLLNTPTSFLKVLDNSQERLSPGVNNENKQPSIHSQAKSGAVLTIINAGDKQQLPFPSLKTATNFTWCCLLKRKPVHLLQNDQTSSVYSSWPISSDNPNPLGLSTKVALSLLNSKQKAGKPSYTQAISTNFRSDILVYSSKWKSDLLKRALIKQKAAREISNKEISTDQENESSAKSEPRRVKIFDGGYKSNEEYVYVRGRGRGKYICEECGIRCKKPSMLKKHIRTHTDVRPYHCNYCNFSFKTKGNLTKHMKSKAHSKKCMDLGVSVGLIEDQDIEEYGEKQRLGYDRSGFDADDSDGPDEDENDNEDDDEDSQAESVISATPSVSASPQHHPSRNVSQEISSADEEIKIVDCYAGVHTDTLDVLPKALLTKMTVLSSVQSDCRSAGPPVAVICREANEGSLQNSSADTEPPAPSETVSRSPCHQMYVDYPDTEVLRSSAPTVTATVTSKSTTLTRLPSPPLDRNTQTTKVSPSMTSLFPESQEQRLEEHPPQAMKLAPPQTHLFSHLPLHSQQQTKTPYGMVPVGGIHVVPAGLAAYSTFLPIQAQPVQLTIPAVSVIHRTTSALGSPACAVAGSASPLGVAEVNSVVPCIPIGQINVPRIQSLSAPTLQSLPSLSMETVNILGLTSTNVTPQMHPSGLTLNAVGLQVLAANPSPQSNSSPQAHIPGLQILNIALPTLIPSVSPVTADGQGIAETPASSNTACETCPDQGFAKLPDSNSSQIPSGLSPQVALADQRRSIEHLLEPALSSEYRRQDRPGKLASEKSDSESPTKPKCNISSVCVEQASASDPPTKGNADALPTSPRRRTVSLDRQVHRQKEVAERQNIVEFSDGSSDDEDRLVIAT